jgi:hypothetical protein
MSETQVKSMETTADCIGSRAALARKRTTLRSLRLLDLRCNAYMLALPAHNLLCMHQVDKQQAEDALKGAGGALPTIHRRISSGQMLLYRT